MFKHNKIVQINNMSQGEISKIYREDASRGAGEGATAPPKIGPKKGKNLDFRKFSKSVVMATLLAPPEKKS